MSSIQTMDGHASHRPDTAPVDQKLEVVIIPVSDVDRAKKFYEGLGWRLDADFANGDDWRLVQMTPPVSWPRIQLGRHHADRASARNRKASRWVRADRPEAPLVRVVRGLHRCARARENS